MKLGTELSAATFWMVVIFCLRMGLWELRQWLVGLAWGCVLTELTMRRKCRASDGEKMELLRDLKAWDV